MEAIWVASEMRVGAAYAHSTLALDLLQPDPVGDDEYGKFS